MFPVSHIYLFVGGGESLAKLDGDHCRIWLPGSATVVLHSLPCLSFPALPCLAFSALHCLLCVALHSLPGLQSLPSLACSVQCMPNPLSSIKVVFDLIFIFQTRWQES